MADSDYDIACRLRDCLNQLVHGKITERKKQVENLKKFLKNSTALAHLNRSTAIRRRKENPPGNCILITWAKVFSHVKDFIEQEAEKLRDQEDATENASNIVLANRKAAKQMCCDLFRYFVVALKSNEQYYLSIQIIEHILAVLTNNYTLTAFGFLYSKILEKELLCDPFLCLQLPENIFDEALEIYSRLLKKPPREWDRCTLTHIFLQLLQAYCNMYPLPVARICRFFSTIFDSLRQEKTGRHFENLFHSLILVCRSLKSSSPHQLCELGESILLPIVHFWYTRPNETCKNLMLEFIFLQLTLHRQMECSEEGGKPIWTQNWTLWKSHLLQLYQMILKEINYVCDKNKYSTSKESVLKSNFITVAIEVCAQAFQFCPNSLEVTQMSFSFDSAGSAKKRRIEVDFQTLIESLSSTSTSNLGEIVPWLQLISEFLLKYPQIVPVEQIENVSELLIQFHLTCNQLDTKNWLLYCCQAVVYAVCSNSGSSNPGDSGCDWQRLWELGVRSVSLMHQCAETGHQLLATMLFYKLVTPKSEFYNLYLQGSNNRVSKSSLRTLAIYLQKYSLPAGNVSSIQPRASETSTFAFRNQVLEWIFSRMNDDNSPFQILSVNMDPTTFELLAQVIALLCLQNNECNSEVELNFEATETFHWINKIEEELLFITFDFSFNCFEKREEKKANTIANTNCINGTLLPTLWNKSLDFFLNAAAHLIEEQTCNAEQPGSSVFLKLAYLIYEMLNMFHFQGIIKTEDLTSHRLTAILKKSLSSAAEIEKKGNRGMKSSEDYIQLKDFILRVLNNVNQKKSSDSCDLLAAVVVDGIPEYFLNSLLNSCLETTTNEGISSSPDFANDSTHDEFDISNSDDGLLLTAQTMPKRRNKYSATPQDISEPEYAEQFDPTLETKDSLQLMNKDTLPEQIRLQLQYLDTIGQLCTFISGNMNLNQVKFFPLKVGNSFISKIKKRHLKKAADVQLLIEMSRCIALNEPLDPIVFSEILKTSKEILNKFGKLQDVCVAIIELLALLYSRLPIESSSEDQNNKKHLLHLLYIFLKKESEGKTMHETSFALAKTMFSLIKLEPTIQWKTTSDADEDIEKCYQSFAFLIKSHHHLVRLFVTSHVEDIFVLCPNIDLQCKMFEDLYMKCAHSLEFKDEGDGVPTVDEKFSRLSTLFHFLRSVILHVPTSEKDALFYMCQLAKSKKTSQMQVMKVLKDISNSLGYESVKAFVEPRLHYLIYKWLNSNFSIDEFPYRILNMENIESFLSSYCDIFIPPIFFACDMNSIADIAQKLRLDPSDIIYSCLPAIQSQIICWFSANPRDTKAEACKTLLESLVPLQVIEASLYNKLDHIVIHLLARLKGNSEEDIILRNSELMINLCSISRDEFYSIINFIMSKLDYEGPFAGFLGREEDNIQNILLHLSVKLFKAKRHYEQRHIIQMYRLFIELLLPEFHICLKNCGTFIMRDIIYTVINFLIHKKNFEICNEQNVNSCVELLYTVCEQAIQYFPEDIGQILPFIVSSLTPLVNSTARTSVLSLFSLLVIQSEDNLSDYIRFLDPFPQNELFWNLCQRQEQLVYQNKRLSLEKDIENFLMSFKMTGKATKEGLKHLFLQLSSKHDEMQKMLDGFQNKVLFSEDVKLSVFHQLVCKLTHLCTPGVAQDDVQIEASRCLGVIGPVTFSTTVLQPSSFSSKEERSDLLQNCEFILRLLSDYLIDPRTEIKVTASEVLKDVFSTKMAQSFLSAFKTEKGQDALLRYVYPFFACHKKTKPKSCCAFELNMENIKIDSLWLPESISHAEWIRNLVCTILESGITKSNFFESLLPLCRKEASFCENILPYMIHFILLKENTDVQEVLSSGISLFFSHLSKWLETNSAGKVKASSDYSISNLYFDRASVQAVLSVVYYLWLHPKKETQESGNLVHQFWLSLNHLQVAQAAQFCSAYFTAVLYTEMWCDISREKKRNEDILEEMKEEHSGSSSQHSSTLSISSQDRDKATLVYDILLNAYSSIGDIDALYGCEEVATDSQSIVRHSYQIEKKWGELLKLYDQDNSSMGVLQTLQMCGLNNVLQGYLQSWHNSNSKVPAEVAEYQYQCAWRLNQWNLPFSETENAGFYENFYKSQQCLNTDNKIGFCKNLELARSKLFESLSHTSLESTRNVLPFLCNLQMLSTLEEFSNAESGLETLKELMENWDVQNRFPYEDFEFMEPVLWLRCMLLKHQMKIDFSRHAVFPKLSKFLERYIEICRRETSLENASSALHSLRSLPSSEEEDGLRWEMEHAKILWIKKEHTIAIKVLKSLLQTIEKQGEESSGIMKIYGEALTLEGRWLAETCSENSTIIMQEYLEKAVNALDRVSQDESSSDEHAIWDAYLAVARYADAQYQSIVDYKKSTAYQTKQELMQHSREEIEKMQNSKDLSDDAKKTRMILLRQLNIDYEELKNLDVDQQKFLIKAITHYLKCLRGTDTHDLWVFRLISLWFENLTNSEVNNLINSNIEALHTYKFLPMMYQLAARMGTQVQPQFSKNLSQLITRIAVDHPHHALPIILALGNANKDPTDNKKPATASKKVIFQQSDVPAIKERMLAAEKILSKLQQSKVSAILKDTSMLCDAYISLAYLSAEEVQATKQKKGKIPDKEQIRKLKNLSKIPIITEELKVDRSCQYSNIIGIYCFNPEYSLIGGITVPKVIKCIGMDGKEREQLVKGRDDLRQDAVMQQVFSLVNNLLRQKIETRRRKLCIRTYKVVPVSRRSGVIQWCEGTQVLSNYLTGPPGGNGGAHRRYYPNMATHLESQRKMKTIANFSFLSKKREVFDSICKEFPPVLRYFFLENFPEPCAWFERRQSYTKSVAASSIVGYILGLGDRHVNNILLNKNTAEVVHIDFGIAFEKGRILTTPETVPFRLTRDVVDGMGISGVEGTFKRCCEKTLEVMRDSQDVLLTILEVLLYDPLYDWTVPPSKSNSQQRNRLSNTDHQEVNKLAERALMRLQQKLQGLEDGVSLSISGQVNLLIHQARDPNNLCRLYAGWQPYL